MKESDVRLKVSHSLRVFGYWSVHGTDAVKCGKCGNLYYPKKGRPDLLCLHPTALGIVVEVKTVRPGETSFSFNKIDDDQREWLDRWEDDGGGGYIALGIIRQHGKVQRLDNLFLVDWSAWKATEEIVSSIQASIPVCADRCRSKLLREREWDILTLFSLWEMRREKGLWQLPDGHTARR